MVVWKELQDEDDDARAREDLDSIDALRGCGLLKLFHAPSMISHVKLLEYILRMWNPEQQYFEVQTHIVTVDAKYIYFMIRLSRHGEPISLKGSLG